jgi:hypothetical protein
VNSRIVAPARGLRWLAEGWRTFRAAPLGWLALVFGYWLAMTLLSLIPLVGLVAATLLVPAFSVGFMAASRAASLGQPLELPMLFAGFRERVPAQLVLGAAYFAGLAAAIGASALADGGVLARWMLTGQQPVAEAAEAAPLYLAMGAAALVYAPVMMMLWFSPLLVAWHAMAPAKALFYSFFACWLNWRAFLAYGLATLVIAFLLPAGALLLLAAIAGGAARASPLALLLPLLLVLLPTLLASFYASYRDVFEAKERA